MRVGSYHLSHNNERLLYTLVALPPVRWLYLSVAVVLFDRAGGSVGPEYTNRLEERIVDENYDNEFFVELLYNYSKGFLKDMPSAMAKIIDSYWTDGSEEIYEVIRSDLMNSAVSSSFNEKTIVVFVAHSEGNLYVQRLLEDAMIKQTLSPYKPKVISVASPIVHKWPDVYYIINRRDFLFITMFLPAMSAQRPQLALEQALGLRRRYSRPKDACSIPLNTHFILEGPLTLFSKAESNSRPFYTSTIVKTQCHTSDLCCTV